MTYILTSLLFAALLTYLIFRAVSISRNKQRPATDGYFISSQTQSNERLASLGLDVPSENAAHILDKTRLSVPDEKAPGEEMKFEPDPETAWIIELAPAGDAPLRKEYLRNMFDAKWHTEFESGIYGLIPGDKKPEDREGLQAR